MSGLRKQFRQGATCTQLCGASQIADSMHTGRRVLCDPRSVCGWDLGPRVREAGGAILGDKLSVHQLRSMSLVLLQMRTSEES